MLRSRIASFAAHHVDFVSFAAVGLFTGIIYFVCISVLLELFRADYRIAITIAYAIALVCHFLANRNLTFRGNAGQLHLQLLKYGGMVCINYLTTMGIVIGTVKVLNGSPYIGALLAIGINLLLNYFISKYWIFSGG